MDPACSRNPLRSVIPYTGLKCTHRVYIGACIYVHAYKQDKIKHTEHVYSQIINIHAAYTHKHVYLYMHIGVNHAWFLWGDENLHDFGIWYREASCMKIIASFYVQEYEMIKLSNKW